MRLSSLLFILWVLLHLSKLHAQPTPHNRIWYFGAGHTLQFTPTGPQTGGIPAPVGNAYSLHSGNEESSLAICNAQGSLQFFTQIRGVVQSTFAFPYINNAVKVFDRNGMPFPNGNIEANFYDGNSGNPLVIPHPANTHQYYLFHVNNGALLYSLVDMNLNNGWGDIIPAEKNIKLTGYGIVSGRKLTSVQGCGQKVWLIVRNQTSNEYYSFAVTTAGLQTQKVVSQTGLQPLAQYINIHSTWWGGAIKASHNGKYLVAGTNKGIELYDFEPCSGKLKNARMIDTIGAMGLCFSPDDTKLYSTQLDKEWGTVDRGKVYQYQFDADNLPATQASKTLILENPILYWPGWLTHTSGYLGDIKEGPDQKLYIANNTHFMSDDAPPLPVPPATSVFMYQGMHILHQPNAVGLSCQPEINALPLLGYRLNRTGFMLPHEIISTNNHIPDTLKHPAQFIDVCFAKTHTLLADTTAACYHWDDGSDQQNRVVDSSGTYWVQYFKDCTLHTDTFKVTFIPLPQVPQLNYGCPNEGIINIPAPSNNHTSFTYALFNSAAQSVATITSSGAVQFTGLAAGTYTLNIKAATCDTTLQLTIDEFPIPDLVVSPTDTTIYYGDTLQLQVSGALLYAWSPAAHLDTATKANPMAWPRQPTLYEVIGINAYGCRATAYARVHINYEMPTLLPNAFTPNGDGLNDVFRFEGISFHKLHVLRVVNRYGQIVFESENPQAAWDGTYKGKPCDAGVYFYYAELVRPDGKVFRYRGDVSLLR